MCGMGYGGCIVLGGFFLSDDDGAASLGDEGIGQILDWCGDIGCGGFLEPGCLHRKKGYGGCGPAGVQDGFRQAVYRLGGDGGGCGLGAAHLTGAAAADGHQKYDGDGHDVGGVRVLHGAYHLLQR